MPEQLLHRADVVAEFQEVRGEGVAHFEFAQSSGMALPSPADEALDPVNVSLFSAATVVQAPYRLVHLLQQTRLAPVRGGRKRKGIARVRLSDGTVRLAEVHWYEAHGIGRKEEFKIKRYVD